MQKFLVLICGSLIAFLLLKYRGPIKQFTGDFDFAEKYLGTGGTNTFFVLLAILIFVITLMYFTGTLPTISSSTVVEGF